MRRLVVAAAFGAVGSVVWVVGALRLNAARPVAWAPLWPRPDGSVRSFGEVWDHPDAREPLGRRLPDGAGPSALG